MRILQISEIHGDLESLSQVVEHAKQTNPDVLACAGNYLGILLSREQIGEMQQAFGVIRQNIGVGIPINDELFDQVMRHPKASDDLKRAVEVYRKIEREFDEKAVKQYGEMEAILKEFNGTFYSVPGNWDTMRYFDNEFFKFADVHRSAILHRDFKFSGIGFAGESPVCTPPSKIESISDEQIYVRLMSDKPEADIVLSNIPSWGYQDKIHVNGEEVNIGNFALLSFQRTSNPSLIMCGQARDSFGATRDNHTGTYVINSGNLGRLPGAKRHGTFGEIEMDEGKYVTQFKAYQIQSGKAKEVGKTDFKN